MNITICQAGEVESREASRRAKLVAAALNLRSQVDVLHWSFLNYGVPIGKGERNEFRDPRATATPVKSFFTPLNFKTQGSPGHYGLQPQAKGPKRDWRWLVVALFCLAFALAAFALMKAVN